jgi:hypothetical protein
MDERSPETERDAVPPGGVEAHGGLRAAGVSAYDYLLLYIGCTSLAIMALVAASAFSPLRALALGVLLALAATVGVRAWRGGTPANGGHADPWLIGTLLLALYFRANISTNYMGGLDPGLYVAFAGIIEHTGGSFFPDLFHAGLPEHLKALYERASLHGIGPLGDGLHYQMVFYPLHAAWMAVFSGLFGADAHGYSVLTFSLLGVTGAYLFARELGAGDGRAEARLAAILTAVNPVLCYLAKMPLSEAQSTAFTMNAAYLLTKALRSEGRVQILLFGTSLLLVIGFFLTRLSFPVLLVPGVALYLLSYSERLGAVTAGRLRGYLWSTVAGLALALLVYHASTPALLGAVFAMYYKLIAPHPYVLAAALLLAAGMLAAAAAPLRKQLNVAVEYAARASERAGPWLPVILSLASIPGMVEVARKGVLFYPGDIGAALHITPEPSAFRYHLFYRLALALTPFLLGILLALPWLVTNRRRMAIPLLFLGGTWGLTLAFAPTLPDLYYHMRFIGSEVVPFSLVILSIVLIAMTNSGRYRRALAVATTFAALAVMIVFSAAQLRGREGEDARFFHEIEELVSNNDVIVADERDVGHRLTVPLRYYFNKQFFLLPRDATSNDTVELINYLARPGRGYGQAFILSRQPAVGGLLDATLQTSLRLSESGNSNSENFRLDQIQSTDVRHMLLPTMWRTVVQTFYLYRVNGIANDRPPAGCSIDFSSKGDSRRHAVSGWGEQEPTHRWTVGPEAALHVSLPSRDSDLRRIRLNATAFAPDDKPQRVQVLVDARNVADLKVEGGRWSDYDIDLGAPLGPGEHEIVFRLPDAHSPKSAGLGDDARALGIALASLSFLSPDAGSGRCD